MLRSNRWAVVLLCVATAASAYAQSGLVIAGGVYDDRPALAARANFIPIGGATVKLYRDDAPVATARTAAKTGIYVFSGLAPGNYRVAVDSRSLGPAGTWAEQTFGPAGALCARPDGTPRTLTAEGPCFGGKSLASDDASTLAGSEHIAAVSLKEQITNADFAFSFDAVTTTEDGERVQGSLRQFVQNANAIGGPNRMRFVPITAAPEQRTAISGTSPRWWSITLAAALPPLRDTDTILDGTAWSFVSPASIANVHSGRLGEPDTIRLEELRTIRQEKPELELVLTGPTGIDCNARCGMRSLAMHGAPVAVFLRDDARLDHVMIGASPDGHAANPGSIGLQIDGGMTVAESLFVSSQTKAGIMVDAKGRIEATHADVSRSGDPVTGGAIVLQSDGSSIRSSLVTANPGAGIVIGSSDESRAVSGNTIDGSTISSNQSGVVLAGGASRNVITRNDIMWNRLGGITVAPVKTAVPRENRFSANRFDENGLRPIILDLGAREPNMLAGALDSCDRVATAANNGISPPRVESVRVAGEQVILRGRACPGELVEIYQSYVTSGIRDTKPDLPRIRREAGDERESVNNMERTMGMPSIGEFNFLGATNTAADGTFQVTFPFPMLRRTERGDVPPDETDVWAREVMTSADPTDRAFSALAIDAAGNTSELSVRRKVD